MIPDTTRGVSWLAIYADGRVSEGSTLEEWVAAPSTDLVLVDVYEPKEWAPGKPYRWRMECEWFGCREGPDGLLEFCRVHEEDAALDPAYVWKHGVLIPDAEMEAIRAVAG